MKKVYVRTKNGETVLVDGIGEVSPSPKQVSLSSKLLGALAACSIIEVSEEAVVEPVAKKPDKKLNRRK